MLSHEQVWAALDALAEKYQLTASGLARNSGLDPTSFNKSKRFTSGGRERWPSTESISKALRATGASVSEFMELVVEVGPEDQKTDFSKVRYDLAPKQHIPLLGFTQAGVGGFFDDGGFPAGQGWDEIEFPHGEHDSIYALEVSGDSMEPLYREGDIVIIAPSAGIRKGDRVVVKTIDGEVMAKVLARKSAKQIELQSLNPAHEDITFQLSEVEWIARILWASQ